LITSTKVITEMIRNMQCCGNCRFRDFDVDDIHVYEWCGADLAKIHNKPSNSICDNYKSDNLTMKQREEI